MLDSIEIVRSLYAYNRWVNGLLFSLAEQVPEGRVRESFGGSFDTILGTTVHIVQGEMHYFGRCTGLPQTRRPADLQTVREVHALQEEEAREWTRYVEELTPERLAETIRYSTRDGASFELPRWNFVLQMVNHGTHHRAELADMLTRVGLAPPPTDLAVYFQEQAAARAS